MCRCRRMIIWICSLCVKIYSLLWLFYHSKESLKESIYQAKWQSCTIPMIKILYLSLLNSIDVFFWRIFYKLKLLWYLCLKIHFQKFHFIFHWKICFANKLLANYFSRIKMVGKTHQFEELKIASKSTKSFPWKISERRRSIKLERLRLLEKIFPLGKHCMKQ